MACKHADSMMIYAKQASEMDEPWKLWEFRKPGGGWLKLTEHPTWRPRYEYRQIPKTLPINGIEVPEPMREKPEIRATYWCVFPGNAEGAKTYIWMNDRVDNFLFDRGLCHDTRENCIIHAKALFSFTENKE